MSIFFLILISCLCDCVVHTCTKSERRWLAGNIAGFSTQFMGVKQTTDVLEKGTWIFAALIALLCLFSAFFINSGGKAVREINARPTTNQTTPVQPNQNQQANPPPTNPTPINRGTPPAGLGLVGGGFACWF